MEADDSRRNYPRFSPKNLPKNLELVDKIHPLASKKGVTPSQFVLAWVLAQGPDFFVIPGTKRVKYLDDNLGASQVTLTPEKVAEMRKIVEEAEVAGTQYKADYKWADKTKE